MSKEKWTAPLIRQKYVTHEHNGCVGDQGIEVTTLDLLCQPEMLFGHLKEHLNIPVHIRQILCTATKPLHEKPTHAHHKNSTKW